MNRGSLNLEKMVEKTTATGQALENTDHTAAPLTHNAGAEAGKPCPVCKIGVMDYDGLLNLVCQVCGFSEGGCFT